MELNTDVWTEGTTFFTDSDNKPFLIPSVGDGSFYSLVNSGKINLNTELSDESAFFGCNLKNPNSIFTWFAIEGDSGGGPWYGVPKFIAESPAVDTLLLLAHNTGSTSMKIDYTFSPRLAYNQSLDIMNAGFHIRPIIRFPFTSIVFLINVRVAEQPNADAAGYSTFGNIPIYPIDEYFGTDIEKRYPYIIAIEFIPYVGSPKLRQQPTSGYAYTITPSMFGLFKNYSTLAYYNKGDMYGIPFSNDGYNYICGGYYKGYTDSGERYNCLLYNTPYGSKLWDFVTGNNVCSIFKGTRQDILKIAANTGVYCATTTNAAKTADLTNITDPHIIIGKMNDTGNVTDTILSGENANNTPQHDWNNNTDYGNVFNGIDNTDPNNYTDKIDLNKPTLTPVDVFNRSYAINATTVRNFADFLWNADETKFDEIIKGLGLMGENPINGIIDLRLYPFNVATKNGVTTAEEIAIGRIATGITGIKLTNSVNSIIDLGECSFFTKFKNFLDYEPYTTAQLYIPYIGVVPVSTAEFMGHNISVKMIVDYVTGACCAIVFKDDIPFIYRNGVVGISIPITGTDSASYANTVIGNVVSGAVGGITSIANGNIGGMVSSAEKLYSGFATGTNYQEASASSPSVATWQPQKCYFIIDRPILNVPDNYGRTVGYACEQTGKLSDFKGFTVVSNPEISFKCTETEKTMLSQLLTAGVFI